MSEQFGNRKLDRVYRQGMHEGTSPEFPVSYEDLRERASSLIASWARSRRSS